MAKTVKRGILRDWCKKNNVKYAWLAARLNVSPQTIKVWNMGRGRPRRLIAIQLSKITGISLSDLGW